MSVHLHDHAEWTDQLEPASRELLAHRWPDATKVFSARGLDNYVKGAAALRGLGRGAELVNAWIDSAPQVAQEIGEDVVGELATTALLQTYVLVRIGNYHKAAFTYEGWDLQFIQIQFLKSFI